MEQVAHTDARAAASAKPNARSTVKPRPTPKPLPPYNVVLLDDQQHTYAYVIDMLKHLFGYEEVKGFVLAKEVDTKGRVIVLTTHRERAELKRDQIIGYGADVRRARSTCGMGAIIEPAKGA